MMFMIMLTLFTKKFEFENLRIVFLANCYYLLFIPRSDVKKYEFENLRADYYLAFQMTSEILVLELIHRVATCLFEVSQRNWTVVDKGCSTTVAY